VIRFLLIGSMYLLAVLLLSMPAMAEDGDGPAGGSAAATEDRYLTDAQRRQREDFAEIGVDERLGEVIDLDLPVTDINGREATLRQFTSGDVPTALVFVYHDCPMLCSMVLDGLVKTIRETSLTLGTDYRVVAFSIDPRDTPKRAAEAFARYAPMVESAGGPDEGMVFLTASQETITALTDATGFKYRWLDDRQEFAHTAVVTLISPNGVITRYIYGLQPVPADFRRALLEAGEGTIGSTIDQLLLYCFIYDPASGGYILHATNAMKLGGAATLFLLVLALFVFWRREKRTNQANRLAGGGWRDYEDALSIRPTP
jgi:protein SCO1